MKKQKNTRQDFYFKKAKEQNYPARSVYKLQEINKKYRFIMPGDFVLDIGCAPGSWMIYLAEKVGKKGMVTGVDIVDLKIPLKENMKFIKADIRELVNGFSKKFDVIVSDAAPGTSGVHFVDVAKSLELAKTALDVVKQSLKRRGTFVCKIFEGDGTDEFLEEIKTLFTFVKSYRPSAVRKYSREFYLIAKIFKNE
ncbi:RlmE family RNA methyltransferase [Patescibacteria group bacterium]|nr:RlmE family RNA methyltransferase [Patescibacteria group bacterium]MBU4162115.1 RlmE family RNA methyltransferase [Patescibacteria group bacterium]